MNPRIILLTIGMFATGTNALIVTGVLDDLSRRLQTTQSIAGLGVATFSIMFALSAPTATILLGRLDRRTIMAIGMAVFVLGCVGEILSAEPVGYLVWRAVVGVGAGMFVPQGSAAALELSDEAHQGRALAIVGLGTAGSLALGAPLGALVGGLWGYQGAFGLVATLGLLGLVALIWVPRLPQRAGGGLSAPAAALRDPRLLLIVATTCSISTCINTMLTYLRPFADATAPGSVELLPFALVVFGVMSVVSYLVVGPLIDRFGGFAIIATCLTVFTATVLCLGLLHGFVAFVVLLGIFGFMGNANMPALQFEIGRLGGDPSPGLALHSAAIFLGAALGSALGAIAISVAPTALLPFFAVITPSVGVCLAYYQLVARRRGPGTAPQTV